MAGTHSAKDKDLAGAAVEDGALTPPTASTSRFPTGPSSAWSANPAPANR